MKARSIGTRTRSRFESAVSVICVVKVGGSLFNWPQLPSALDNWLNEQSPAFSVLIAGGGVLVESIRRANRTFPLDDELAHWLAIDAMSIHARLLAGLLANANLVSTYYDLCAALKKGMCKRIVFDPNEFVRKHEAGSAGNVLPHNWSVTSDSIAARVAEVLGADELVLLKSSDSTSNSTSQLANDGFVDRYFPAFDCCCFRTRFVNLRRAATCTLALGCVPTL